MAGIEQKLNITQKTSVVMTTQLQKAIHLLQLPQQDLAQYITEFAAQNPLLELETHDNNALPPEDLNPDTGESFDKMIFSDYMPTTKSSGTYENILRQEETLEDHLLQQLHISTSDKTLHTIGEYLIYNIDPCGYWHETIEETAKKCHVPIKTMEKAITLLKTFDPIGIFSSSLAECLQKQLEDKNQLTKPFCAFLENLDLLEKHNIKGLQEKCQVPLTQLKDMLRQLQQLDPKPGLRFSNIRTQNVMPDVYVYYAEDTWRIELDTRILPKVLMNQDYYHEISNTPCNKEEKRYIKNAYIEANWLLKSLNQRADTILNVATKIVSLQKAFFNHGLRFLKPLTLQDIATDLDIHESTVSRVVNEKFMATPKGVFPFKYFFSSGIQRGGLTAMAQHSSTFVRNRIKILIDGEEKAAPLSDQVLTSILEKEGITIARRTVTKYREGFNIPSSSYRRKRIT